jgi:hypothetical protein
MSNGGGANQVIWQPLGVRLLEGPRGAHSCSAAVRWKRWKLKKKKNVKKNAITKLSCPRALLGSTVVSCGVRVCQNGMDSAHVL